MWDLVLEVKQVSTFPIQGLTWFLEVSRNLEYPEILTLLISKLSVTYNWKTKPNHIPVEHAGKPAKIPFPVIADDK